MDGIAAVSIGRDGERGIAISVTRSSGAIERRVFVFPLLIYRRVFVQGQLYEPGDMVTWAGSVWHCNEPTDVKPDADARAWTLAVKRGRDGKDARS
ncbi:hypothetical protein QFZ99_006083 [Paraburkholderia atlantica]|uniref:hypothetical protein n=1 Tax=Paraburkholderia atlantica TaxID=2654982 RepID=UPI003D1C74B0